MRVSWTDAGWVGALADRLEMLSAAPSAARLADLKAHLAEQPDSYLGDDAYRLIEAAQTWLADADRAVPRFRGAQLIARARAGAVPAVPAPWAGM
ncbi:hypothetical protein [Sandarakinorhabdus sp.]|uniref:hypothetical protein n=1 Tax=Sandarakinorhabdus sp. TaxID=1916663 RepID=UPI00286D7275|nr:hypothetical protein [Sandarakinorhabdus sp.]